MRRSLRNLARLVGIARILARHDALAALEGLGTLPLLIARVFRALRRLSGRPRAEGRVGERLVAAAAALGPTYVKLGQALSTRPDLIGAEVAEDLARLRDKLPAFGAAEARAAVEQAFGVPLPTLFAHFDDRPVAAASIAQVHFAETADGDPVAVKILRPGIEAAFARDLDLLAWLAALIEGTQRKWRRLRPAAAVATFADMVAIEMDLRLEGAAAAELAENFKDDPTYRVPTVDWRRTGRRVLTTSRIEGIPLDSRERLIVAGHDPDRIMAHAASALFLQVFRDGFFHGDPHPGNLFVADDGAIQVVDFGIMGRLDMQSRRFIAEILLGFLTRDYQRVADTHFRAGYVPGDRSRDAFAQACRSIGEPILGLPAGQISVGRLLGQLFEVTETFGMRTQPHLLLLQKVLVVAEGVGRELNPEANMWDLARPLAEDWVRRNLGPEARVREAARGAAEAAARVPALADDAAFLVARLAARERAGPAPLARTLGPLWWLAAGVWLGIVVSLLF